MSAVQIFHTSRHSLRSVFNQLLANHFAVTALPAVLALLLVILPVTVSCQRAGEAGRGMPELRALIAGAEGKPDPAELARLEARFPQTRAAALARFLRGYLAFSSQSYATAVDAFDAKVIGAHTSLGDYAYYFRAESEAAAGSRKEALRDYKELYARYADSIKAREARLKAAEMMIELNDANGAIKALSTMAEAADADAIYLTGLAYEALGQNNKAVGLYRQLYYELPATTARVKAESRLAALNAAPKDNPGSFESEKTRADRLFESKQYGDAARAYDTLIALFPDAERLDEVHLRRGISLYESKQYAPAVLPLAKVTGRDADMQAKALFYQARALRASNRAAESIVLVDRLCSQFAKHQRAAAALHDLIAYLEKNNRQAEAASRQRQLITLFPRSAFAAEATYELGFQAYQANNFAEAARLLEQHLLNHRYPDTKMIGEAGFYAGKSNERLGRRARALALYDLVVARYPYGFDGVMAQRRATALRNADRSLKAEHSPDLARMRENATFIVPVRESADDSASVRIAKADDLMAAGADELAIKELNDELNKAPESPLLNLRLAQVFAQRGDNFQATLILRRGYPDLYSYKDDEVPKEAWGIYFPLHHWDTIKQEARRYAIDPYLAAGLIRQESVFNAKAVSRVGARGLMQVMPATGRLVSKQQGLDVVTANDLLNPQLNIKLGMNYLAQMIGQLGRFEYAAAGYNAGPGRAKRWVAERGSLDLEDWIESIPFSETRGYVKGVLRYAANYRRFYKD